MLDCVRYWQFRLKQMMSQLVLTDWLMLFLLGFFGWLTFEALATVGVNPALASDFFPLFLLVAITLGYLCRPSNTTQETGGGSPSAVWLAVIRSMALATVFVALPILALLQFDAPSTGVVWLKIINTLLIITAATMIGNLGAFLPKRWGIPLLLVVVWWIYSGNGLIIGNLVAALADNGQDVQAVTLMIALGLFGACAAALELTKPYHRTFRRALFTRVWSFEHPLPSFTGMGSLLIVSILRVIRDKVFLIYLGSFMFLLLSRVVMDGWSIDWLLILALSLAGLSALIVARLNDFSHFFSRQFAHLPISPGQVDFVGYFAGLTLITAVSWVIIWGLFGVTAVAMTRLLSATINGFGGSFLLLLSMRQIRLVGLFNPIWRLMVQLTVFWLIFVFSLRLDLTGTSGLTLIITLIAVMTTCYPVIRASATIK